APGPPPPPPVPAHPNRVHSHPPAIGAWMWAGGVGDDDILIPAHSIDLASTVGAESVIDPRKLPTQCMVSAMRPSTPAPVDDGVESRRPRWEEGMSGVVESAELSAGDHDTVGASMSHRPPTTPSQQRLLCPICPHQPNNVRYLEMHVAVDHFKCHPR